MPVRNTIFVNDYYYHIFNRSIAKLLIYQSKRDYRRFLELINYYRYPGESFPFSLYYKMSDTDKEEKLKKLQGKPARVEIICYCLMPNHYHFVLKQLVDNGIMEFVRNIQNSYAKYFNTRNKRKGSLFEGRFKGILIKDDYQLVHLTRYIHLNPYSSGVIKKIVNLNDYPWSSFAQYLGRENGICNPKTVLGSRKKYKEFVYDRAEYQKELNVIKHLIV